MNKLNNNTNKKYNIMNLKKFENQELFEQYKQSSEYKEPNVALVGDTIMYNGSVSNSGGGGGLTYFDVSGFDLYNSPIDDFIVIATIIKAIVVTGNSDMGINTGDIVIFPTSYISMFKELISIQLIACGVSLQETLVMSGQSATIEESIKNMVGEEFYNSIPRLTREEFYNLEQ